MTITFDKVSFAYKSQIASPGNRAFGLHHLSFAIHAGEFVAIVGSSGSGKTTLLHLFNGLFRPAAGAVKVEGADIHEKSFDLTALRFRIGLAFQFPEAQLFGMTVREDLGFGPTQQGLPEHEVQSRVEFACSQVGLSVDYLERNPMMLSQGEKRRVAIAGILAMQPEFLVLDEPTASLDARGQQEVKRVLRDWHASGKAVVLITHDADLVAELAQRVLVLHLGGIIFDGPPASLWQAEDETATAVRQQAGVPLPRRERLRRLLASKNLELPASVE